ncbi:unnamed protein product [Rotaria sp. Silwood2]|nr:unnamed protein product [Rotaria sp. Silwood2]CAF4751371.1 unnamed protein product [Rotaria sp. Silwood2]
MNEPTSFQAQTVRLVQLAWTLSPILTATPLNCSSPLSPLPSIASNPKEDTPPNISVSHFSPTAPYKS